MPKQSFAYDYENKTYTGNVRDWNDTLKVVGGHPITYDNNGNPLRYRNSQYVFTWTAGRQLATATHGGKSMSYTYDESGLRQSKTVDGVKTTYTWNGDKITSQSDGTNNFYFFYDGDKISAFEYNGSMYYYVRNLQGDVVGIVDSDNTVVAEYAYDAWGKLVKVQDGSGNTVDVNINHIANLNPIRYRGYYYDTELQMYYLQSRYYDPTVSRFINSDAPEMIILAQEGNIQATNLFAYCENNPVINIDKTGFSKLSILLDILLLVGGFSPLKFWLKVSMLAIYAIRLVVAVYEYKQALKRYQKGSFDYAYAVMSFYVTVAMIIIGSLSVLLSAKKLAKKIGVSIFRDIVTVWGSAISGSFLIADIILQCAQSGRNPTAAQVKRVMGKR